MASSTETVVKVFESATPGAAVVTNRDRSIRYPVELDEKLRGKMCRRPRAYFKAKLGDDGCFALFKRLPDQGW